MITREVLKRMSSVLVFTFRKKTNIGVVKDMEVDRSIRVMCLLVLIKLI